MNMNDLIAIEKSINNTHIHRGTYYSEEAFDAVKDLQRRLQVAAGRDITTNKIINLMLIHYGMLAKEGKL